jgi:hypothetical protein
MRILYTMRTLFNSGRIILRRILRTVRALFFLTAGPPPNIDPS